MVISASMMVTETILNTATPLFCCHYKYDVQQGRQKDMVSLWGYNVRYDLPILPDW